MSASGLSLKAKLSKNTVTQLEKDPKRSPTVENAISLADALGVSLSYLALGEDESPKRLGDQNQATAWAPPTSGGERPDLDDSRRRLPQTLAPNAREPALFKLSVTFGDLGYRKGDVVVVDLKRQAKDGDIVLARVMDLSDGSSTVILRRLFSPFLISAGLDENMPVIVADGSRTVIMGVVAASFRAPQLDHSSPI